MLSTCPNCGRPLTKANSWHLCEKRSVEDLFQKKPPELLALCKQLLSKMKRWKGLQYSATKNCIVCVHKTSFCIIRPMKAALDIKFYLGYEHHEFPVYKAEAWGKKWGHYIRLHDEEDLDEIVVSLLKESFENG